MLYYLYNGILFHLLQKVPWKNIYQHENIPKIQKYSVKKKEAVGGGKKKIKIHRQSDLRMLSIGSRCGEIMG